MNIFKSFAEAAEYMRKNQIRMVDLKFSDLWGRGHHVPISAREFTPALMTEGVGFDGSSVGFKSVKAGDMVLIPDLAAGFMEWIQVDDLFTREDAREWVFALA